MEAFLDIVWEKLYGLILSTAGGLDAVLSPLHPLIGPGGVIILLALITVCSTKFLGKKCRTKRHVMLEKDFYHWLGVREEAMRGEDREKASRMARNIDQAKLNKCYYDYFLEGLLLSFATMYLPILMMMSYVNTFYRPERLIALTSKDHVLQLGSSSNDPILIGSIFFYFVSLMSFYISWIVLKKVLERRRRKQIIHEINSRQGVVT